MSPYESPLSFALVGVLSLGALLLGRAERPLRGYALASSVIVAAAYASFHPREGWWFAGTLAAFVALIHAHLWFRTRHPTRHGWEKKVAVLLAVTPLVAMKLAGPFHWGVWGFLGASYLTFRVVQVVLETSDRLITTLRLTDTLAFLLFFPTMASGPIDRSRRFALDVAQVWSRAEYDTLVRVGVRRIVLGYAYSAIAAPLFGAWLRTRPRGFDLAALYAYGGQLFFDFAGYSLMAVGVSALFGVRTPMNFRLPFVAENIRDFWSRWHITLSFWLRDYVYSRLMMTLVKRTPLPSPAAHRIALFTNMMVMGLWHGPELRYLAYGAYHGALMVLTDWWERSPWASGWRVRAGYRVVSIVVTAHLVLVGFLIFSGRLTG